MGLCNNDGAPLPSTAEARDEIGADFCVACAVKIGRISEARGREMTAQEDGADEAPVASSA